MYDLRQQVGRNAGFDNFRDYTHQEKNRFDYTPDDCFRFHEAVETAVRPAVGRLMERRKRQMNLDALRPWDITADPKGRPALKPFDDVATLIDRAGAVFAHVDPQFRAYYRSMADADLLDVVDVAVEARLLEAAEDGTRVRFAHALIREVLYEALVSPRRRLWHQRVADALPGDFPLSVLPMRRTSAENDGKYRSRKASASV